MKRTTYVVYVKFPSSDREYCYLCNIPNLKVGDEVIANSTRVRVHRIAAFDSIATREVRPVLSEAEMTRSRRRAEIHKRLAVLENEEAQLARWAKLKSNEAKRLLRELKGLRQ